MAQAAQQIGLLLFVKSIAIHNIKRVIRKKKAKEEAAAYLQSRVLLAIT
jgi:hypothetical protein